MSREATIPVQHVASATTASAAVHISRVRWLVRLRWIYFVMLLGLALFTSLSPQGRLAWVYSTLACTFAIENVAFYLVCHSAMRKDSKAILIFTGVELAVDMAVIATLLLFTGGFLNPLVGFLSFHAALSASLMPRSTSYLLCIWASLLLLACFFLEGLLQNRGILSWYDFARVEAHQTEPLNYPWDWMAWAAVTALFFISTYFTRSIIGRLRHINTRLTDANRRLSALDLTKSRFLRVSSHQLRSPLAAIHTMLSAIQEAGGFNPRQYDIIRKLQVRSEDAMALVDEMMLLSTIREAAAETRQLESVGVDAVAQSEAALFADEARSKGLTIEVAADSHACIQAWEDALETVLEHLLSNAVKYTPAGGKVAVVVRSADGKVLIEVSDTGIGIPAQQQDRLCHEFFRATNARQVAGGTGMGLAIVHAIVERLGGTIRISSQENQGTQVLVSLLESKQAVVGSDLSTMKGP